jgi:trans-2,3-dihydro-3-hydroxyanthranilate isomerase
MKYRYITCDVFTDTRFGGNPLAVLPEASGLSDTQMQQIAREFNYSETTFVFPPEGDHTRKVRIFTPSQEIPFAGHPNVGTAFVLAASGALGKAGSFLTVTFEEKAGVVPVTIAEADGKIVSCELKAPQALSFGETVPSQLVASAVSLQAEDILTRTHPPQIASVGLPFLFVELRDRAALERVRANIKGFEAVRDALSEGHRASLYLYTYTRDAEGADIRARMLAPLSGIPEDPATGSAGCAVVGLLTHYRAEASGEFSYRIAQGVEMGRPSILLGRATKSSGVVEATWIAGSCILVMEGLIQAGS